MKICELWIENFRGIKTAKLLFPDHVVLIGDNNVGKSTVLEALDLVLGPDRLSRPSPIDEHDFYLGKYMPPDNDEAASPQIVVTATVSGLSEEQQSHFGDYVEWRDPIPAALITGIRSDLPGQITAQVTEAVFDSPTGRAKLVPQGARLIGIYDSQVAFGQSRVLLVWTRLIMPNGRSIVLERQQGADAGGYSGLEDEVDNHWAELFKAALLSTILGVGAELGSGADTGSNTDILQALRLSAANSLNQTGQQVVRRNLNIQPTLTIRPGFPVRVIVNRDLVLEPYRG